MNKKVKITLVLLMFLRIVQKVNFGATQMKDVFRSRFRLSLYYIYATGREAELLTERKSAQLALWRASWGDLRSVVAIHKCHDLMQFRK